MRFTDSTQWVLLRGDQYDNRHRTPLSRGGGGEWEGPDPGWKVCEVVIDGF
jgi:hypothetical protein